MNDIYRDTTYYYICDRCGNLATIVNEPIADDGGFACDECGGVALWEFTDKTKALDHSEHIRRINRSGLFREASIADAFTPPDPFSRR